jgi:hypothetical protein
MLIVTGANGRLGRYVDTSAARKPLTEIALGRRGYVVRWAKRARISSISAREARRAFSENP